MENNENIQDDDFYQKLHALNGEIPSKSEFAELSKEQKAETVSRLKQNGRNVREISEITGYAVSSIYKLLKHAKMPEAVELESKTFLDNFIDRRTMLEERIAELSKLAQMELPKYKDSIDEETGDAYREVLSGSSSRYSEVARLRYNYECQLLDLERKAAILPSKDVGAYSTLSESKPEELAKEDVENLTDTELLLKLVADLKRNGKSGSLASLKDEKILGD